MANEAFISAKLRDNRDDDERRGGGGCLGARYLTIIQGLFRNSDLRDTGSFWSSQSRYWAPRERELPDMIKVGRRLLLLSAIRRVSGRAQ